VTAPQAGSTSDDWEEHWSEYAESASLNPAQEYRRRLVRRLLAAGPGARILDIGSGQGDQALDLLDAWPAANVLGVDLSAAGIAVAQRKVPAATFLRHDLTEPLEPPGEYRAWATHAVCSEVLEHVERPELLLANVTPLLAPGCRLVVTVPGGPRSAFDRHIGHRRHYTADDLRALLEGAGFEVELAGGAGFPFFNLYRLAVVARGEKLVDDVSAGHGTVTGSARLAMRTFDVLFRANRSNTRHGWQIVAVALAPPSTS
jgi:2-polyprenyl-3-methyl-5-hydroxy-6-metoxy-1,4-benzoquinol methylase